MLSTERFVTICRERRINKFPAREDFQTGGIVGSVEIVDCVTACQSYWFSGDYGFVLRNARRTRFRPMKGKLGFFEASQLRCLYGDRRAEQHFRNIPD